MSAPSPLVGPHDRLTPGATLHEAFGLGSVSTRSTLGHPRDPEGTP